MTRHQLPAAPYAPLRVVLFEHEQGRAVFEYDKPLSFFGRFGFGRFGFGRFGDERVPDIGRYLDATLAPVPRNAAEKSRMWANVFARNVGWRMAIRRRAAPRAACAAKTAGRVGGWKFGAALSAATMLAGCTVGPDFHRSAPPDADRFTEHPTPTQTAGAATTGGTAQRPRTGRDIPGDWWNLFHSPRIEALVTQALKANPDLAAPGDVA
jgi:hypothetical protein